MWEQIRTNFIAALAQQRVDKWLVEESRGTNDLLTKFRQLGDVIAFSKFLDNQVAKEKATNSGGNNGAIFIATRGSYYS